MTTAATGLGPRAAEAFADYRAGRPERLADLVRLLTPLLWHTARSQNAPAAIAEDAVQTAWLRLIDTAGSIADPRAVTSWLVVTVKRETWRLMRLEGREAEPAIGLPDVPTERTPEATAVLSERQRTLWRHITALSPRCQALLRVIAYAAQADYAEISGALGMPMGSIGPTRGRCLAKLRDTLMADPTWGKDNE
ncbi:MAG: sigma-70 family RNA polymerase sigma factor [Propionibacteriaceae bacterium]|nr:sigma-70 family RNA polymerase sigma factor [Propionibacteriaceae bacterium]